jgi:hypothetical protein
MNWPWNSTSPRWIEPWRLFGTIPIWKGATSIQPRNLSNKHGSVLPGRRSKPMAIYVESFGWRVKTLPVVAMSSPVWLGFYIPMGVLESLFSHLKPFYDRQRDWRETLDNMLASMGEAVYGRAQFSLGLIGFEVSGDAYAETLKKTGIPSQRRMGYLWPKQGEVTYHPANQWGHAQLAAS